MIRLHAIVEGQTEETFVRDILGPHLMNYQISCDAQRITTSRTRNKSYRGGLVKYAHLCSDLRIRMKGDRNPDSWFTTLIDLYALPEEMPGFTEASQQRDPFKRVEILEEALKKKAVEDALGNDRFVPYIQLHEFEALLLVDPEKMIYDFPGREKQLQQLKNDILDFPTPEHINDGLQTAPSKRIIHYIPEYEGRKPSVGPLAANRIGLERLRVACPHFNKWLSRLEKLPS